MSNPTHQDAMVYLQYLTYQASIDYKAASDFVWSDDFPQTFEAYQSKINPGSPEQKKLALFSHVHETLGVIYKHGLIHPALLFDREDFQTTWERIENIVHGYRHKNNRPEFMQHFEALVESERRYREGQTA
jgi:hypothetical protein